ncbi:unnamed protein product, partial [Clonostachys chloroleuca]
MRKSIQGKLKREPLEYSGSLDEFISFEVTPLLGTEFSELQVASILGDDNKLRDLAILASRRGVLFFRNQELSIPQQKILVQKMGELTGKPSTSKLSKHALYTKGMVAHLEEAGEFDPEVVEIWSQVERKNYPQRYTNPRPFASGGWHVDLGYEKIPGDYSSLYLTKAPKDGDKYDCGGDTLWVSGYELYDQLSPPMKKMVDGLDAVHSRTVKFQKLAQELGFELNTDRGAPENRGIDLESSHPLVRTNPVTGWKSLYGASASRPEEWIEGVTKAECEMLRDYFHQLKVENYDLQARFKWNENDLAVWDNRATLHTATL